MIYPSVEKEIAGLLFGTENQSSIGDVLGPMVSMLLSLKYPFVFVDKGDKEASEPSTG